MNQGFGKKEKLKSKILIDTLFAEGSSLSQFPLKLVYAPIIDASIINHKTGVSVPKRNFPKAVDRNHLKRLMREAFRKNKYLINGNLKSSYSLMFLYMGKRKCDAHELFLLTKKLLEKFVEKELK